MGIEWCFENGSIKKTDTFIQDVLGLREVIDIARDNNESIYTNSKIYNAKFDGDKELYQWLFETNDMDRDYRNMLLQLITKSEESNDEKYESVLTNTEEFEFGLLNLHKTDERIIKVSTKEERIKLLRHYLSKEQSVDEFYLRLNKCFPNIYFHSNIKQTLNTLSDSIVNYSNMLIYHLSYINDVFPECFKVHKAKGLRVVLEEFKNKTGIDCSVECGRDTTKERLSFNFNGINIVCEAHTKLHHTGEGDLVKRYDRIYFHQGDERVQPGKILVGHIGKHL